MPSRRSILGTAASLLAAGCSQWSSTGRSSTTSTTRTTTPPPTTSDPIHVPTRLEWGASTEYDGTSVTVNRAWSQHSVVTLTTPDSFGARRFDGKQLLFATTSAVGTGPIPRPDDFAVEAGGERYVGWTSYEGLHTYRFRLGEAISAYDPKAPGEGGWVGFALPEQVAVTDVMLHLQFAGESEGATFWPLPDAVQESLRAPPPEFTLESIDVPESVPAGESFEVALTVSNTGQGSGTFRAAVNEAGPQYIGHAVRIPIQPGEQETRTVTITGPRGTDASSTTLRIVTPDRSLKRTVQIE